MAGGVRKLFGTNWKSKVFGDGTQPPQVSRPSARTRKVMCGKETMKAAGTVTKKLAKWLDEKGYVGDTSDAQERAQADRSVGCDEP